MSAKIRGILHAPPNPLTVGWVPLAFAVIGSTSPRSDKYRDVVSVEEFPDVGRKLQLRKALLIHFFITGPTGLSSIR
jgi:hypothetical protein